MLDQYWKLREYSMPFSVIHAQANMQVSNCRCRSTRDQPAWVINRHIAGLIGQKSIIT